MSSEKNRRGLLQFLGIRHHEYWPWWMLVIPVWPLWIWYAVKLRCATWFTVVNPGMEDSGFLGESKIKILDSIPDEYKPKTIFIPEGTDFDVIINYLHAFQLLFPLICKPDVGGRGRKVEIISSLAELEDYHNSVAEDYMIQDIIPYEFEFGIFYTRLPEQQHGKVISVAAKDFLKVKGNGIHTIRELMQKDYRAALQTNRLEKIMNLEIIPEQDKTILLEPIGNHCRGTAFLQANHLINDHMNYAFDRIAKKIPGFFYGRFDIKVKSVDDLYTGNNIMIMELNGLTSDAAHIFDPQYRLRDAYKTQIQNCNLSYSIAIQNLKHGAKPTPVLELMKKCRHYFNM